jgi:hypothetical protein
VKNVKKQAKRAPKSRCEDRRVIEILATFELFAGHWCRPFDADDLPELFMRTAIGLEWSGWSDDAYRSTLTTMVLVAPDADLDDMRAKVCSYTKWLREFAVHSTYERMTGRSTDDAYDVALASVRQLERTFGRAAMRHEVERIITDAVIAQKAAA